MTKQQSQPENRLLCQFHHHVGIELGRQFWRQCAIELMLHLESQINSHILRRSIWFQIKDQLEHQLSDQILAARGEFTTITT